MISREQRTADRFRAEAAAEIVADNRPIGEAPSRTAGMGTPMTYVAPQVASRARMLIIAAEPATPEVIAHAIASELKRPLYPVDLSRVISKFIAQTEKHLEEVFDVAGEDNSILFFEDADALFGSGGDAAGIHFADQEVGYLLHHIEGFDGICILSVHAATAVDAAVQGRFTCVVRA